MRLITSFLTLSSSFLLCETSFAWTHSSDVLSWKNIRKARRARISSRPADCDSLLATSKSVETSSSKQTTAAIDHEGSSSWLNHGVLLSSFSDGLIPNEGAKEFLLEGIVASLWKEKQQLMEELVSETAEQSPCCGPDQKHLEALEQVDAAIQKHLLERSSWQDMWKSFKQASSQENGDDHDSKINSLEIRVLYIPTALYALRKDSTRTPGKQRQQARSDGKKKRNQLVQFLSSHLTDEDDDDTETDILAVTLDLSDASLKQAEGSDDPKRFPSSGTDAIAKWKPHLIYVQGGNTFWLHHCLEKGSWQQDIVNACTNDGFSVYCGTSAGAILAGSLMETATWKGWDDPSVVPGRETYEDWKGVKGLELVGSNSFFPHMTDDWIDTYEERRQTLPKGHNVCQIRDEDAYCIRGGIGGGRGGEEDRENKKGHTITVVTSTSS